MSESDLRHARLVPTWRPSRTVRDTSRAFRRSDSYKAVSKLCSHKGRLYLIERAGDPHSARGKRIFVLSLQGETLFSYECPHPEKVFWDICCFDGKLLCVTRPRKQPSDEVEQAPDDVIALRGL